MQGNIRRWRLGPLGPRDAGVYRKAIVDWQKRAVVVNEEIKKYKSEYMKRFNRK